MDVCEHLSQLVSYCALSTPCLPGAALPTAAVGFETHLKTHTPAFLSHRPMGYEVLNWTMGN